MILHGEHLQGVAPSLVLAVQTAWAGLWYDVLIVNGLRTEDEQQALYAQGRTLPGNVVTDAPTAATSPHGARVLQDGEAWGCAVDAVPCIAGKALWADMAKLTEMANAVEGWGVDWGGNFQKLHDYDHFELHGWRLWPPSVSPVVTLEG